MVTPQLWQAKRFAALLREMGCLIITFSLVDFAFSTFIGRSSFIKAFAVPFTLILMGAGFFAWGIRIEVKYGPFDD